VGRQTGVSRANARCEVCGNEYAGAFAIIIAHERHVFDSFECAIHALAPECAHCGCKIVGHGMQVDAAFYCCAHCAGAHGIRELRDHA
jgi:hypothetical protein